MDIVEVPNEIVGSTQTFETLSASKDCIGLIVIFGLCLLLLLAALSFAPSCLIVNVPLRKQICAFTCCWFVIGRARSQQMHEERISRRSCNRHWPVDPIPVATTH